MINEINWDIRCLNSIAKEKKDVSENYGIKFGATDIYCARCGKAWGYGKHTCQGTSYQEPTEEKPIPSFDELEYWRQEINIQLGMTRDEALDKFREWRGSKKNCIRCQENEYQYNEFCRVNLICREVRLNGESNGQSINFGKKSGGGVGNVSVNPLRSTPKRASMDKFRG